jgi:hypothetical protein
MKNKYFLLLGVAFLGSSVFAQDTPDKSVWKNEGAEANWNTVEAWTDGLPGANTKTVFNVPAASDCIIDTDDALVKNLVVGDGGAYGGTIIIKDGGVLTCGAEGDWSTIGYNAGGFMSIEKGGALVVEGNRFHVGLVAPAEAAEVSLEVAGTLTTPKFTVNDPGDANWDASCYVFDGGVINTDILWIGTGGLIDVTGGTININSTEGHSAEANKTAVMEYITAGKLTAEGGDEEASVEWVVTGADTVTVITSSTTVGIAPNRTERATVSVYPNPATDVVYFKESMVATVEMY